ncbi:DNA primase (bacterial type) [Legionella busanensis]|uniref:DNA primase (Bacterial type) n=1 Tax=Legionella busanensis TaxID=190655 RepID=A0A378JI82_9GAMM|nr:bifunctional DNA primase/helicase [Legionella busanensis]STX50471.1 DNA primase (bacterial type) [Legionella busanensis]
MMAREISNLLAQNAEDIARLLLPNGKKEGDEWRAGSVNGEAGKSLGVHLTGEKAGVWADFANGDKGDLLDLWAKTQNLSLHEAIKEAATHLGIFSPRFISYKPEKFAKPKQKYRAIGQSSSPVMQYLIEKRKLLLGTIKAFKIGERGRQTIFPYWRNNELIFIKYLNLDRPEGKKIMSVELNCEPCLFGWDLMPDAARSVIICEGEIDAMTLYQYGLPALSVPFGGGTGNKHRWIEYEFDRLSIFDEIYLCLDNDEEGLLATLELIERLGRHRCRIVNLPYKDANECLVANIDPDKIYRCFKEAKTCDPDELKSATQFVDQVIEFFYPPPNANLGYQPPWEKTKGKIVFRPAELSVWTGINGHGKSQFLGQIILGCITQGAKVCIASLELKPGRMLMRLTKQAGALSQPTKEYIRAIHKWYENKLWIFDLLGTTKAQRLLDVFLYARQRYGIDVFVIDSFMKLDIAEDDLKAQKALMEKLCDFKNEHNCHVHIVVHPRKGQDESKPPGKLDTKGTGAISDLADNCFSIWRNKDKEKLIREQSFSEQNTTDKVINLESEVDCVWGCDKQRNGDWEGGFSFWFDKLSLQYLCRPEKKPYRFVEYSSCGD